MGVMDKFNITGKVAIMTGGARGLGEAMGEALADAGAKVAVLDIDLEQAKVTAARLSEAYGVDCKAYSVDVSKYESCKQAVDAVLADYGKIDILVNNAGICYNEDAETVPVEMWDKVIDINLNGVWYMAQLAGVQMIKQGGGSIINIGSMSGVIVNNPQGQASYNAAKAGVIHLSKSLATEWADNNVRVNTISPGYMNTDLCKATLREGGPWATTWMEFTPQRRAGEPEELGPLVVYLASDASTFMTGSNILIDGGYTCW